jgi:hypothetical protein
MQSVVILSLDGFGLKGSLPSNLSALTELSVLGLGNNPLLSGSLPLSLLSLSKLLWLSVKVGHQGVSVIRGCVIRGCVIRWGIRGCQLSGSRSCLVFSRLGKNQSVSRSAGLVALCMHLTHHTGPHGAVRAA